MTGSASGILLGRSLLWAVAVGGAVVLGLPSHRPAVGSSLLAALSGAPAGAALFAVLARRPLPRISARDASPSLAACVAYLCLSASFEEVLWRGLALGGLAQTVGRLPALLGTSLAFASWHHAVLGRRASAHLGTGTVFGVLFLLGGLPAAILAHAVYNLLVHLAVRSERPEGASS